MKAHPSEATNPEPKDGCKDVRPKTTSRISPSQLAAWADALDRLEVCSLHTRRVLDAIVLQMRAAVQSW